METKELTFEDFLMAIYDGLSNGDLKISQDMTVTDWAVYFAIGKIRERKQQKKEECIITYDEIYAEIMTFAPYVFEEEK